MVSRLPRFVLRESSLSGTQLLSVRTLKSASRFRLETWDLEPFTPSL